MTRFALLLTALFFVGCATSGQAPDGWSNTGPEGFAPERRVVMATEPSEQSPPATTLPTPVEETEESEYPRHSLAVALNYVTENRAAGGWAVGLEYGYRFNSRWSVGGFAEYLSGDFDVGVFGVLGYWFPWERLGIAFGPGIEISEGEENRWLGRFGIVYEIEEGDFFIAPGVYADVMDDGDVALMLGGSIGMFF